MERLRGVGSRRGRILGVGGRRRQTRSAGFAGG